MTKIAKSVLKLLLVLLILFIISIANQLIFSSKTAYADEILNIAIKEEVIENECVYNGNGYISFQTDKVHYEENEIISVSYVSHYENGIADISYTQDGFNVLSLNIDQEDNKVFTVNVSYEPSRVDYYLQMQVEHIGGELAIVELHGYLNEYGMFISQFSQDSAREKFYTFAKEQNLMTEKECQKARVEFWNKDNEKFSGLIENVQSNTQCETIASTSNTIEIRGNLSWKDDNANSHPLRYVKVELYRNSISSANANLIDTAYADSSGIYCLEVNKSSFSSSLTAVSVYVVVYASDDNVSVQIEDTGICYKDEQKVYINLETGTVRDQDIEFTMEKSIGQAMQISQALFTARNYAQYLMGETPAPVKAYYPTGSSFHYAGTSKILLGKHSNGIVESYAAWDPIMHEYGHHVQCQIKNANTPSLFHSMDRNEIDFYDLKDHGSRLAWGEAWATVFGMLAQQYYSSQLYGIPTTRNEVYESFNSQAYNLETSTICLGEGCELSIIAVLWDLYDSEYDTNDTIALGHNDFWNLTAVEGLETFSDFVNHFYEEKPYLISSIGLNLTYYKMATTAPIMTNSSSVSQTVPPSFNWTAQGGSTLYPNNSFQLVICDDNYKEIFRSSALSSTSYTLTQSEWQSVLYSYGRVYCVAVSAMQTANPVTGEYISAFTTYLKPSPPTLSQDIYMYAEERYVEKVVTLQPSQYIEYYVTFQSGKKLIQTFGTCDTIMEIYDANGTLLNELDDEGYSFNSLATLNVTSDNTQYKIKVYLYDSWEFGTVKFTIVPAFDDREYQVETITKYEDILEIHSYETFYWGSFCYEGYMNVLRFSPPTSGTYSISLSSVFDNYLYVIDPRSAEALLNGKDYSDDYDDLNACITRYLEAGVQYFIIYGQFDPSEPFIDYDTGDDIEVSFRKLS